MRDTTRKVDESQKSQEMMEVEEPETSARDTKAPTVKKKPVMDIKYQTALQKIALHAMHRVSKFVNIKYLIKFAAVRLQ